MSIRDKLISGPLGFSSAPLGNMFRNIPEAEAAATVDAHRPLTQANFPRAFQEIEYESEEFTDVVDYRLFERLRP